MASSRKRLPLSERPPARAAAPHFASVIFFSLFLGKSQYTSASSREVDRKTQEDSRLRAHTKRSEFRFYITSSFKDYPPLPACFIYLGVSEHLQSETHRPEPRTRHILNVVSAKKEP